jgi:hypothetical protein
LTSDNISEELTVTKEHFHPPYICTPFYSRIPIESPVRKPFPEVRQPGRPQHVKPAQMLISYNKTVIEPANLLSASTGLPLVPKMASVVFCKENENTLFSQKFNIE